MANRLAKETSPYLLQHAHNPVDWYPWGDEAFAKARAEDKPVFLSIGYSACHWCHVMERESFENDGIAAILNRDFVSIKVDREERPDVDSIYMQAVQMMTGHGGWPMSVFLTPDAKPFFAGTYFPPVDRQGMPGFDRVLQHVHEAYSLRREEVAAASNEVTQAIQGSVRVPRASGLITHESLDRAAHGIAKQYDREHGGFGGAPKFPPSMSLEFLMQVAARTGDERLRAVVLHTLVAMARGGIYDQIGGGFHRYSVDARWLVPHFEKMLYDNALLARLYTRAWQWTKEPFLGRVAVETLDFVAREMTSPDGGFYSTLDADSEGVEGKFYVWDRAEVLDLLGEEGQVFCVLYDITDRGNWEHRNIANLPRPAEDVAKESGLSQEQLSDLAARGRRKLYEARARRVWPGRDEKMLAGWNGWMLAAFSEAAIAFDRSDYRAVAARNADFLLARIDPDGRLVRHARIPGLLEDYSGAAWGLALAFEATHDRRYLDASRQLADQVLARFRDESGGGFFDTPVDHEALITRPKDLFDNATPAGNAVMADVLLRLALLFGDDTYGRAAGETLETLWPFAERYPSAFGFALSAAEWRIGRPKEIVVTGPIDDARFRALRAAAGADFVPHRVIVAGSGVSDLPLLQERPADRVLAYVCEGYACKEPTEDPETLGRQLISGAE